MEIRQVGCSGLRVSRLGLGTMTWGRDTSAENALALLDMFCEAGGTLIDTAAAYAAGDAERSGHVNLRVVRTFRVTISPRRTEFSP